jgi:hypothetical protein
MGSTRGAALSIKGVREHAGRRASVLHRGLEGFKAEFPLSAYCNQKDGVRSERASRASRANGAGRSPGGRPKERLRPSKNKWGFKADYPGPRSRPKT